MDPFDMTGGNSSSIFTYLEQEKTGHDKTGLDKARTTHVAHALAISASVVIVLAGIKYASGLVGPMLLALFLAIVLLIPLRWLQKHGCPQFLAFLFVLVSSIALFVGIIYFVSRSLNDFIGRIPAYRDRIVQRYNQLESDIEKLGFQIGGLRSMLPGKEAVKPEDTQKPGPKPPEEQPPEILPPPHAVPAAALPEENGHSEKNEPENETPDDPEGTEPEDKKSAEMPVFEEIKPVPADEVAKWVAESKPDLIALDPQSLMLWIAKGALQIRHAIESGLIILIFTIFMLFEASHFPAKVDRAFGKDGVINNRHFHRIADDIRRYLVLKTLANLMSGSAAMFVYYLFGVPGAFFWGIVAFFMYYIPNIGGTLAAVIPGILVFMNHDITGVLLYAVCLVLIECSIAYGIEPKMLGHGLRLSTMVIILTLFFWGFILGPIGLFLAAPLTVMLKIILQAFPETNWLAIFLDDNRKT
ncbi:MAG: AI-2E family transporter [Planctomycetaceae bacterium]|jgi:predicted PurR-regulated permease PerM|nr:AI-2E family transporter [Planctomycetaceae bacterium]